MQPMSQGEPPSGQPGPPDELDPNAWISFRDGKLEQHEPSPYAWASIRDGELLKAVLLNAAAARRPHPLRVLEWGTGKSTLSFTELFDDRGVPFRWLALEYDRKFCDADITGSLLQRPAAVLRYIEDDQVLTGPAGDGSTIEVVCWNGTPLRPFMGDAYLADRTADLDAYVNYPRTLGERFDVVMVDGRKRRRCLHVARDLMADQGVVLLHDAYRSYYHCATDTYPASRFFGDALWIGAEHDAALRTALKDQEARA